MVNSVFAVVVDDLISHRDEHEDNEDARLDHHVLGLSLVPRAVVTATVVTVVAMARIARICRVARVRGIRVAVADRRAG